MHLSVDIVTLCFLWFICVVKRILCEWLTSGGNISFSFLFFTLTTKRNVIVPGILARWSLKWFPQLPAQPYLSRALIDSPSLSLSLRGSARDRLCWVVVSGLVVLLLYNKPGWLADHSPTELWVLAQSYGSITSRHPSSQTLAAQPVCLWASLPLYLFPALVFVFVTLHPAVSLIFGSYPLIPAMITVG